jgi:hypothetical protein
MDPPIPRPRCRAPTQSTEPVRPGGTAGPVEHPKAGCVNDHWLFP